MIKSPSELLHSFDEDPNTRIVSLDDQFYRVPKFNIGENPDIITAIENNGDLNTFFSKLVTEAARIVKVPVESFEQDWLVQLLTRFCTRQEFFDMINSDDSDPEKDKVQYRYLVDMAVEAMKATNQASRAIRYLTVGDQALFTVGFFPERIARQMGEDGIRYYLNMSRTGYGRAASVLGEDFINSLADRVDDFRKVIRCVCTATRHEDLQPFDRFMLDCGQAEPIIAH